MFKTILNNAGFYEPFDREAELSVIRMMLHSDQALSHALGSLTSDAFHDIDCSDYFNTIEKIWYNCDRMISPTDILKRLTFEKVSKLGLADSTKCVSYEIFLSQIEKIKQTFLRRKMIHCAYCLLEDGFDGNVSTKSIEDTAEKVTGGLWLAINDFHKNLHNGSKVRDSINYFLQDLERRQECGPICGIPSGYQKLDTITGGWHNGNLILTAAYPTIGLETFVLTMARNTAVEFNLPTAYISPINSSNKLMHRLIVNETGISSNKLNGKVKMEPFEWGELDKQLAPICKAPLHIIPTSFSSFGELQSEILRLVRENDVRIIYIDNVDALCSSSKHETIETKDTLFFLKDIASRFHIPIVVSHTFTQEGMDLNDLRPSFHTLYESGTSDKYADVIIFLHRDNQLASSEDDLGKAMVIVAKNTNGDIGEFNLKLNHERCRLEEKADC